MTSEDELLQILSTGTRNRIVAATNMGEMVSRSHSIFSITGIKLEMFCLFYATCLHFKFFACGVV